MAADSWSRAITCPSCAGRGWYYVPVQKGIPKAELPKYLHPYAQAGVLDPVSLKLKEARKVAGLCTQPNWLHRLMRLERDGMDRGTVLAVFQARYKALRR